MSEARSDFELFERAARRHIRNHVMDRGEVPALCAIVSRGWNPRRLRTQMSLHLLPDQLGVKAQLQHMVRENSSRYAAWASRVDTEDGDTLLFVATDGRDLVKWAAPVTVDAGLHGWERADFRPGDVEFIQKPIREMVV